MNGYNINMQATNQSEGHSQESFVLLLVILIHDMGHQMNNMYHWNMDPSGTVLGPNQRQDWVDRTDIDICLWTALITTNLLLWYYQELNAKQIT